MSVIVIRFENVSFLYPGCPPILTRLNLSVEPGETIAIVGRSSAGKTTVLKLVNRLLLPTSGTVSVDGRDAHVPAHQLLELVGLSPTDARIGSRPCSS